MTCRSLVGAAALVVALSSAAFAATAPKVSAADRCAALEKQFTDAAAKADPKTPKLADAQKLAADGTKLCTDKKYASGERKLIAALADLGIKVKM
jgi:hypothetical protein